MTKISLSDLKRVSIFLPYHPDNRKHRFGRYLYVAQPRYSQSNLMKRISLSLFLIGMILCSCDRPDPGMLALEGSYSGNISLLEQTWQYDEGVAVQDTVFEEKTLDINVTMTLAEGMYQVEGLTGEYLVEEDTLVFRNDHFECLEDPSCGTTREGFYGYPYIVEETGDSLLLRFDLDGTSTVFGAARNTTRTVLKRRLRFLRTE